MADGDIVHSNLPKRYLGSYRLFCSPGDDFNPEAFAHTHARAVGKSIEYLGDGPINYICNCVDQLNALLVQSRWKQNVDFGQLSRAVDKLAQGYPCDHRALELAKKAIRQQMDNVRYGQVMLDPVATVQGYFVGINENQFEHRVPLTDKHLNDLSHETVTQRLQEIHPHIEKELSMYAEKAVETRSVAKLRRRPYRQQKKGLHESAY